MKRFFIVWLLLGIFSCKAEIKQSNRPNILWITHEDLGPIYGCYGDEMARTPNIDKFSENSYKFTQAYSNAPICAPARSTLITGMYATSLGTQHLRSEIPVPENMKILPEVLRDAGYYTTNNVKTDYNFDHEGHWDESSKEAHWRNGPEGKPFFSVFNFMITHEGPTNALRSSDTRSLMEFTDPDRVQLPPYLPDSPKMREIWAHMYDLLAVFDQGAGDLLNQLKEDGLLDNTIVFVFSDHGHGLAGHKRWLNNAGLRVPFILHVPEKYKDLVINLDTQEIHQKVGFVDFAPTVITLAGAEVPEMMEGNNFLGASSQPKDFIFGYRDRADDCYEVSRSVTDGRYIYVRHFMPQLPYFQNAVIFNKGGSYAEINRLRGLGQLPEGTEKMFEPKPVEELFDLESDPWEQNNLANKPEMEGLVIQFRGKLNSWMLEHFDTGLINEGLMMMRASQNGSSVQETNRTYSVIDYKKILQAAQMVGMVKDIFELPPFLEGEDPAVRYWALIALDAFEGHIPEGQTYLSGFLRDKSLPVAVKAAEIMVKRYEDAEALDLLKEILHHDFEPLVLQAAIAVRQLGAKAAPLVPDIQNEIMPKYSGEIWGRYRSWSYPMFIGMALDQAQINCGVPLDLSR
ncbi:MAG: sulfatase-like hydrolase/transferase [Cyclobacteriaceae bacterium]